jgi:2-polyprenyl-3-methyl-5-hydroxy-6-metoxy-1,4-benzoquinol methylase
MTERSLIITRHTRVSEILEHYGDIADVMEVFGVKRAGGLALRKVLGKLLTVERAAKVHRVPLDKFLPMVQSAVGQVEPASPASEPAKNSEFSGFKGRFFAWFLTSPLRRILELKMGKPEARILELLQLQGGERVLDSGCGSGFHTLLIAEALKTGSLVAVDISSEMLDRLRTNAAARGLSERVEVLEADILDLPLDDESFDRAISAAVWHHLDDPAKACRELVRTLRIGGRVVVSDLEIKANTKAVRGLDGHDRAFGPDDMRRVMVEAGLQNVQVSQVGRWLLGAGEKLTRS